MQKSNLHLAAVLYILAVMSSVGQVPEGSQSIIGLAVVAISLQTFLATLHHFCASMHVCSNLELCCTRFPVCIGGIRGGSNMLVFTLSVHHMTTSLFPFSHSSEICTQRGIGLTTAPDPMCEAPSQCLTEVANKSIIGFPGSSYTLAMVCIHVTPPPLTPGIPCSISRTAMQYIPCLIQKKKC